MSLNELEEYRETQMKKEMEDENDDTINFIKLDSIT
jgi:hypothetical protein